MILILHPKCKPCLRQIYGTTCLHIIELQNSFQMSKYYIYLILYSSFQFTVGVRDKGIPSLSDTAPVTVTILRIGDIKFDRSEYDLTIRESEHNVGDTVYSIRATDPLVGVRHHIYMFIQCSAIFQNSIIFLHSVLFFSSLKLSVKINCSMDFN